MLEARDNVDDGAPPNATKSAPQASAECQFNPDLLPEEPPPQRNVR